MAINILNIAEFESIIDRLQPAAKPLWGKMSPQHVIEHLASALMISSGKMEVNFFNTEEVAGRIKLIVIHSDKPLQQGIKNPLLGDEPPELRHTSFEKAKEELIDEMRYFENYYSKNPDAKHTQPRMGKLGYQEWLIFHNKHFTHHFNQYGLL